MPDIRTAIPPETKLSLIACPYLGIDEDPATHFAVPESAHCCYALQPRRHIPETYQEERCLDYSYITCPVFVALQQGAAAPPPWNGHLRPAAQGLFSKLFRRRR
jgi:hypothetical protein